jgi:hypothetical protein
MGQATKFILWLIASINKISNWIWLNKKPLMLPPFLNLSCQYYYPKSRLSQGLIGTIFTIRLAHGANFVIIIPVQNSQTPGLFNVFTG